MPHEKINHRQSQQLVVGWNKIGWVQVSIYPDGWTNTGEATIADISAAEIDLLIKTLRRAKKQAYKKGALFGFEPTAEAPKTTPLFSTKN